MPSAKPQQPAPAKPQPKSDPQAKNVEVLQNSVDNLEEKVLYLTQRVDDVLLTVKELLPREALAPPEVWSKITKDQIVADTVQGAIQGVLGSMSLSNFRKENVRRTLCRDILDIADVMLEEAMIKMNQVPREPKS